MHHKLRSLLFALALCGLVMWGVHSFAPLPFLVCWFAAVNVVNFVLMGQDKFASVSKLWRTPEQTFFVLALLGGFPGLFAARNLFKHKTSKRSFVTTMWILFALQLGVSAFYLHRTGVDTHLEFLGLEKKALPSAAEVVN